MVKKVMFAAAMLGFLSGPLLAAPKKAQVLKPGEYAATAKALVCEACAEEIEKTLKRYPGVEAVTVAPKDGKIQFKIKAGTTVKLDELQTALKAESDKMGMGADYTLRDVKLVGQTNKPQQARKE